MKKPADLIEESFETSVSEQFDTYMSNVIAENAGVIAKGEAEKRLRAGLTLLRDSLPKVQTIAQEILGTPAASPAKARRRVKRG
jgi:hypothetical protein